MHAGVTSIILFRIHVIYLPVSFRFISLDLLRPYAAMWKQTTRKHENEEI